MKFITVAKTSEIPPGHMKVVWVEETRLAICNVEGAFYAIEDVCTHDDGPLGQGTLEKDVVECPRHGARFSVRTGAVLRMPAVAPIRTFPVRVEKGEIKVSVDEAQS